MRGKRRLSKTQLKTIDVHDAVFLIPIVLYLIYSSSIDMKSYPWPKLRADVNVFERIDSKTGH